MARHGSWNRTRKIGGDVIVVKLNDDGTVKSQEPFLTGFLENNQYSGRPVDVEIMKDGSLLVSDDYAGAVYRIIGQRCPNVKMLRSSTDQPTLVDYR